MNKNFTKHFIIYYVVSVFTTLSYAQTTVTFTNAGATGREGPSQSQINTAYDGTTLDDAVTVNTQGIQEWTVPASGTYTIEVWGAEGGSGDKQYTNDTERRGGKGARMKADFSLTQGDVLKIIVGQRGDHSGSSCTNADAGGGAGAARRLQP